MSSSLGSQSRPGARAGQIPDSDACRAQRPRANYRQLTVRSESLAQEYDAVLIGAGVGNLTCAAYLAKFGAKVLIVERHSLPGGLCSFFRRNGFYFDAGAHYFGGLGDQKSFGGMLLRPLNLDVEFIHSDPVDILHFPDETIELPGNIELHIEMLQRAFPQEHQQIRDFFQELLRIYRHFSRGRHESDVMAHYRWSSYQEVLDQYFQDSRLKSILSATVGYIGMYPQQVSAIAMAAMMMSYFYDGAYTARGGSQALPDSLMRRLVAEGGHLLLNTAVQRINVNQEQQAESVILATGQEVRTRAVISNADPLQTFCQLLGEEHADASYVQHVKSCRESNSCFVLYLGLECEDEMLRGKRGWHFNSYQTNDPANIPLYIATPTLEDKSLCPPGHNILTASTTYEEPPGAKEHWQDDNWWAQYKERYKRETLARLERIMPGLSKRIRVQECATPRTIHRYTLNSRGAMYGWESSPDQFWLNRLPVETPIENLFLCGHWASSGPGVISVIASGFLVARKVAKLLEETRSPQVEQSVA